MKRILAAALCLLLLAGCAQPAPETPDVPEVLPPPATQPDPVPEPPPEPTPEPEPAGFRLSAGDWTVLLTDQTGAAEAVADPVRPTWITVPEQPADNLSWKLETGVHQTIYVNIPHFGRLRDRALQDRINSAVLDHANNWLAGLMDQTAADALLAEEPEAEALQVWASVGGNGWIVGSLLSVELTLTEQATWMSTEGWWLSDRRIRDDRFYLCIDLHTGQQITDLTGLFRAGFPVADYLNHKAAALLQETLGQEGLKRPFRGLPADTTYFSVQYGGQLAIDLGPDNPLTQWAHTFYIPLWELAAHMPALARNSDDYLFWSEQAGETRPMLLQNTDLLVDDQHWIEDLGTTVRVKAGADRAVLDIINSDTAALEAAILDRSILAPELQSFLRMEDSWASLSGWAYGYGNAIGVQHHLYMSQGQQYRTQQYGALYELSTGRRLTAKELLNEEGIQYIRDNHAWMAEEILTSPQVYLDAWGKLTIYCNYELQYRSFELERSMLDLDWLTEGGI